MPISPGVEVVYRPDPLLYGIGRVQRLEACGLWAVLLPDRTIERFAADELTLRAEWEAELGALDRVRPR